MITKTTWRVLASLLTLAWIIVFFSIHAFTPSIAQTYSIIDSRIFYATLTIISIFLIFFPFHYYLYAIMFCSWGLLHLLQGDSFGSLLVYFLGFAFASRYRFFRENFVLKILLTALPVIAICTQYRFGTVHLINSLLSVLLLGIVSAFVYVLFYNEVFITLKKSFLSNKIDTSSLSQEEINIVRDILKDQTLYAIALGLHKSESTIKQQVTGIYKKLGLYNRAHLLDVYNKGYLILPRSNKL